MPKYHTRNVESLGDGHGRWSDKTDTESIQKDTKSTVDKNIILIFFLATYLSSYHGFKIKY